MIMAAPWNKQQKRNETFKDAQISIIINSLINCYDRLMSFTTLLRIEALPDAHVRVHVGYE